MFRALSPDGSQVDGFAFAGTTVTWTGAEPVEAGIRYELVLEGEPGWLVPGVFYGENRPAACTRIYPRFARGIDIARMESPSWSFRADRCATPAVLCGGRGLATRELSPLGQAGVGFALRDGLPVVWLEFPYREEPLRYDGSETPAPPDVRTYRWQPGEQVTLPFEELDHGDHRRLVRAPLGRFVDSGWVGVEQAAELAAHGLHRWH